jgi:hypothetical protein
MSTKGDPSVDVVTTEHVEDHKDYTSLKRSLSGISTSHAGHAGRTKMKGPKPPKPDPCLKLDIPHPTATEIAFAALRYLPIPVIVLTSLKTIALANEAMGRLLGLHRGTASATDALNGQTLSQIGIDMVQDGMLLCSNVLALFDGSKVYPFGLAGTNFWIILQLA